MTELKGNKKLPLPPIRPYRGTAAFHEAARKEQSSPMTEHPTDATRDLSHWADWSDCELIDQAAGACQHPALIDDEIVREAIALNIIAPLRQALQAARTTPIDDEGLWEALGKFQSPDGTWLGIGKTDFLKAISGKDGK